MVTDLADHRNIKEVELFLEKEILKAKKLDDSLERKSGEKSQSASSLGSTTGSNEYRYMLIKCVNQITQMFPNTIPSMIAPLMDSFLKFEKKGSFASLETIVFIREVIEVYPEHKQSILRKLVSLIDDIKNQLILRVAIWIVGEYSTSQDELDSAFDAIKRNIGSLPVFDPVMEEEKKKAAAEVD